MHYNSGVSKSITWAIVYTFIVMASLVAEAPRLADMSIEELMEISVTSVAKKETSLIESAAAITVITAEDIHQIGAQSIPEALRIVPGINVARINSSNWAISARGFQDQFADKLLVLMDGRTVYTPFFAGVFWAYQDVALEDLDRIEVIRGPGATLWGANAMNGVINIISKSAKDTQGSILTTSMSTLEDYQATGRYGGHINDHLFYRVYIKHRENGSLEIAQGNAPDDWRKAQTGFRLDWHPTGDKAFTFQGDIYIAEQGGQLSEPNIATPPFNNTLTTLDYNSYGGNLLGRFKYQISATDSLTLQSYYNREYLDLNQFEQTIDTFDIDTTYRLQVSESNAVVTGIGYRLISDQFANSPLLELDPTQRTSHLFSMFLQDEMTFFQDKWKLSLGSKFEHNEHTGFEIQPSAQAIWQVTAKQALWGSISRAVHTPARVERDSRLNRSASDTPLSPSLVSIVGSSNVDSETLTAYQVGYRNRFNTHLSLELSAFYNHYYDLQTTRQGAPFVENQNGITRLLIPQYRENTDAGHVMGVEASLNWSSSNNLHWACTYSWLEMKVGSPGTNDASPQHQLNLRNHWQVTDQFAVDNVCYYVDQISNAASGLNVPAYIRWDLGVTWKATDSLQLSLWAQNLLDDQHPEYTSTLSANEYEIPRSITLSTRWKF